MKADVCHPRGRLIDKMPDTYRYNTVKMLDNADMTARNKSQTQRNKEEWMDGRCIAETMNDTYKLMI